MHNLEILSDQNLYNITGGSSKAARATSCGTSCGSRPPLTMDNCNGDCLAVEGNYIACLGPSHVYIKYCDGTVFNK